MKKRNFSLFSLCSFVLLLCSFCLYTVIQKQRLLALTTLFIWHLLLVCLERNPSSVALPEVSSIFPLLKCFFWRSFPHLNRGSKALSFSKCGPRASGGPQKHFVSHPNFIRVRQLYFNHSQSISILSLSIAYIYCTTRLLCQTAAPWQGSGHWLHGNSWHLASLIGSPFCHQC